MPGFEAGHRAALPRVRPRDTRHPERAVGVAFARCRAGVRGRIDRPPRGRRLRGFVEEGLNEGRMNVDARAGARRAGDIAERGDADEVLGAVDLEERRAAAVTVAGHRGLGHDGKRARIHRRHPGRAAASTASLAVVVDAEPHHPRDLPDRARRQRREVQRDRRDGRVFGEDQRADIVLPGAPGGVQSTLDGAHPIGGERGRDVGREHHREHLWGVEVLHAVCRRQDDPRSDQRARADDGRGLRCFSAEGR